MGRRYLEISEVEISLRQGKSVESFLGGLVISDQPGIRWVSIRINGGFYQLDVYESADLGDENFLDVYEFGPIDPDIDFEDAVFQKKFLSLSECSEYLSAQYGVSGPKFVNEGIIQDEYRDYVIAGRPIA